MSKITSTLSQASLGIAVMLMILEMAMAKDCPGFTNRVILMERMRIESVINEVMEMPVVTVTASRSPRSEGGLHDYYSEGDYWWPNPVDPGGPYIRRDGESNPDNFNQHREAIISFSEIVGELTTAYLLTGERRYAKRVADHLGAWFSNSETRMNPHLEFAQAIKGRVSGRSIGIIDAVHLAEVAIAVHHLKQHDMLPTAILDDTVQWFTQYLHWLNTHPYGIEEKTHPNNHSVAWSLQAAAFATLLDNRSQIDAIRSRLSDIYLEKMMTDNGSFPAELARTKPYGYSLFMFDLVAGVTSLVSNDTHDMWQARSTNGHRVSDMYGFIVPYIADKSAWPYARDIQYWDQWPARHVALVLGAIALNEPDYLALWSNLKTAMGTFEVRRNLPLKNPLIWLPHDCLEKSTKAPVEETG